MQVVSEHCSVLRNEIKYLVVIINNWILLTHATSANTIATASTHAPKVNTENESCSIWCLQSPTTFLFSRSHFLSRADFNRFFTPQSPFLRMFPFYKSLNFCFLHLLYNHFYTDWKFDQKSRFVFVCRFGSSKLTMIWS